MTRKRYSSDNRLTIRLSTDQYQKVLTASDKIGCSKADVIRYLLSGHGSSLNQHDLNLLKQADNKATDALNKYYLNLYRIGGNINQIAYNQNLAIKAGHIFHPVSKASLKTLSHALIHTNKLVRKALNKGGIV